MGKGIPGSSVTVVDDEGNDVPTTKGNIAVPLDLPALSKAITKNLSAQRKHKQGNII